MKITGLVTYVDSLSQVENTELMPRTDKPAIRVFLREPVDLISMVRARPEVDEATEDADPAGAEGKTRKVQVVLSGKTVTGEINKVT